MTIRTNEARQGLAAFVGITLGVVPLVMLTFGAPTGGLWGLVLDEGSGPAVWICPCLTAVAAAVALALLERRKR